MMGESLPTSGGASATPPERFSLLVEHTVTGGDRLDNLAAHYFGDPELFWRICDANRALRPDDLTETAGRRLPESRSPRE